MRTKFIEVTNGFNWGKFMIAEFDAEEWARRSSLPEAEGQRMLSGRGWGRQHWLIVDLQTGEGAMFMPLGSARADLRKRRLWVCPMFEPALQWLYDQPMDFDALPDLVELTEADAPSAMAGYRRPGPGEARVDALIKAAESMDDGWDRFMEHDDMDAAIVAIGELREALAVVKEPLDS